MVVLNKSGFWLGALCVRQRGRRGRRGVRKDAEEAEMRSPSVGRGGWGEVSVEGSGGGGVKGCQDEGSDDFQPATFYCRDFPTASRFFFLSACPVSPVKQTRSPQGKLIVEIIQRKEGRGGRGRKKKLNKRQSRVGNATC